jgi:FtsP/CotA-like multicopper oxidase with cupredoxin domain
VMEETGITPQRDKNSRRDFLHVAARIAAGSGVGALAVRLPSGDTAVRPAEPALRAGVFTAAPDGRAREVWGYNGQVPGPLLRLKEGERARIRVENGLRVPTSIHWHGFQQPGTPDMDGVEGVSREPIAPGASFVYDFVARPAGTHWYHSHTGVQYGNGLVRTVHCRGFLAHRRV